MDYRFIIIGFVVALIYKVITNLIVMWFKCGYYERKLKDDSIDGKLKNYTIIDVVLILVGLK